MFQNGWMTLLTRKAQASRGGNVPSLGHGLTWRASFSRSSVIQASTGLIRAPLAIEKLCRGDVHVAQLVQEVLPRSSMSRASSKGASTVQRIQQLLHQMAQEHAPWLLKLAVHISSRSRLAKLQKIVINLHLYPSKEEEVSRLKADLRRLSSASGTSHCPPAAQPDGLKSEAGMNGSPCLQREGAWHTVQESI